MIVSPQALRGEGLGVRGMQLARVVGQAVSTVKHATLTGWRLVLVQPLTTDGEPDGEPVLALDHLGARPDRPVIISSDGLEVRRMVDAKNTPARWFVMGVCDR
jgi:ethanolamine utilization protein EutN